MHGKRLALCLFVAVMPVLVSACGAAHHSIFRNRTVRSSGPSIVTVDAKQRAYLVVPQVRDAAAGRDGATSADRHAQVRMCAEASPDVFSVIAQSLSATGSFERSPDPASIQAAASLAASTSEQGSTIPRTQTINMLRELMYRTCERYLNGAISDLEMPIQAVRDQRLMVAILAIEQLTGAVTPPTVVIGASAGGGAGASPADAIVRLDNARKRLETADADLVTKRNAYNALNVATNPPTCDSITAKVAAGTALTGTEPAKQTQCNTAKAALTAAEGEQEAASSAYQTLQRAMNVGGGGPVTTAGSVQQGEHGSGEIAQAQSKAVTDVAAVVQEIVRQNYAQDEFGLFCLRYLDPSQQNNEALRPPCLEYLTAQVRLEAARADAEAQQLYRADFIASGLSQETFTTPLYEAFRAKVVTNGVIDAAKLGPAVDAGVARFTSIYTSGPPSRMRAVLGRLKLAANDADLRAAFNQLTPALREFLAQ